MVINILEKIIILKYKSIKSHKHITYKSAVGDFFYVRKSLDTYDSLELKRVNKT